MATIQEQLREYQMRHKQETPKEADADGKEDAQAATLGYAGEAAAAGSMVGGRRAVGAHPPANNFGDDAGVGLQNNFEAAGTVGTVGTAGTAGTAGDGTTTDPYATRRGASSGRVVVQDASMAALLERIAALEEENTQLKLGGLLTDETESVATDATRDPAHGRGPVPLTHDGAIPIHIVGNSTESGLDTAMLTAEVVQLRKENSQLADMARRAERKLARERQMARDAKETTELEYLHMAEELKVLEGERNRLLALANQLSANLAAVPSAAAAAAPAAAAEAETRARAEALDADRARLAAELDATRASLQQLQYENTLSLHQLANDQDAVARLQKERDDIQLKLDQAQSQTASLAYSNSMAEASRRALAAHLAMTESALVYLSRKSVHPESDSGSGSSSGSNSGSGSGSSSDSYSGSGSDSGSRSRSDSGSSSSSSDSRGLSDADADFQRHFGPAARRQTSTTMTSVSGSESASSAVSGSSAPPNAPTQRKASKSKNSKSKTGKSKNSKSKNSKSKNSKSKTGKSKTGKSKTKTGKSKTGKSKTGKSENKKAKNKKAKNKKAKNKAKKTRSKSPKSSSRRRRRKAE